MASSVCWECNRKLQTFKGSGLPIFKIFKDPLGHEHRVHKTCFEELQKDKPLTAQATPKGEFKWKI